MNGILTSTRLGCTTSHDVLRGEGEFVRRRKADLESGVHRAMDDSQTRYVSSLFTVCLDVRVTAGHGVVYGRGQFSRVRVIFSSVSSLAVSDMS